MSQHLTKTIAHRGASAYAPEHSLAAIQKALELKPDFIEIDVHLSADKQVVVHHDHNINRCSNGRGNINEMNYSELLQYDFGMWYGDSFKGSKILLLEEVLDLINGKCQLLLEIKGKLKDYPEIADLILKTIDQKKMNDQVIIQSFHRPYLTYLSTVKPKEMELHYLIEWKNKIFPFYFDDGLRFGSWKKLLAFDALNPSYLQITKKFVRKIHSKGKKVFVWTVNNDKKVRHLLDCKVDGIITNYPDKIKHQINLIHE